MLLLILCGVFLSVSAQNQQTCADLDQLAGNTNTNLLSSCARDSSCTRVVCQAAGLLTAYLGRVTFTLEPCGGSPGIHIEILQNGGDSEVDQLVTSPTEIRRSIDVNAFLTVSIDLHAFVNSSTTTLGVSIDPIVVNAGLMTSSYLVSFTSLYLDKSGCHAAGTDAPTTASEEITPSVPLSKVETCIGLDQLALNANPNFLSNCERDDNCTQVTCEGSGVLNGQVDSAAIVLAPCQSPPGIIVQLINSGTAIINQLITTSTSISHDAGIATVEASVFVNSSTDNVGVSIDPFTIDAGFLGTTTDYLIRFTQVPLDISECGSTTTGGGMVTPGSPSFTSESVTTVSAPSSMPTSDVKTSYSIGESTTTITTVSASSSMPTSDVKTSYSIGESTTTNFVKLPCTGLELMAVNTNPDLLSDCERDEPCSQMTCQTAGVITGQLDSVTIHLEPCETPPGITIQLVKDDETIINELITSPTNITHNVGIATVEAYVFVNSTDSSIGISVDPVSISAGSIGSASDVLIDFTLVNLDKSICNTNSLTTMESSEVKGSGWRSKMSTVFLLTFVAVLVSLFIILAQ